MSKRAGLVAAVTALLVVAAGCGEQAVGPGRGQLAVAAAATAEAGTARMAATATMTTPMFEMTMTMEGVTDIAADAAHVTMSLDGGPQMAPVSGEVIVVGGFQYTGGDLARQARPDLAEGLWLRQPLPEGVTGWTDPMRSGSPAGMLELLREVGLDVEEVGAEQVRGVGTTRYRVEANVHDLVEGQPEELRQDLPPGVETTDVPVVLEVWVDGDDLVRRMTMDMDMTALAGTMGGGDMRSVMSMEFYDFGLAVDVTAPPGNQVVDFDLGGL